MQNAEVLHHGAAADSVELSYQLTGGLRLALNIIEQLTPSRIGQGFEDRVEAIG